MTLLLAALVQESPFDMLAEIGKIATISTFSRKMIAPSFWGDAARR